MDGDRVINGDDLYDAVRRLVLWRRPLGALLAWTNALSWSVFRLDNVSFQYSIAFNLGAF